MIHFGTRPPAGHDGVTRSEDKGRVRRYQCQEERQSPPVIREPGNRSITNSFLSCGRSRPLKRRQEFGYALDFATGRRCGLDGSRGQEASDIDGWRVGAGAAFLSG